MAQQFNEYPMTDERVRRVTVYGREDFPENDEWGLKREHLVSPEQIGYRHDVRQINYARGLEGALKAGLNETTALAFAAKCRTLDYMINGVQIDVNQRVHEQRQFGLDEFRGGIRYAGDEQRTEAINTDDVAEFHIPTITQESREIAGGATTQEQLWRLAMTDHKGGPRNADAPAIELRQMKVDRWGGSLAGLENTTVVGLVRQTREANSGMPEVLATFPLNKLELTENERELLELNGQYREDFQEIMLDARQKGEVIDGYSTDDLFKEVINPHFGELRKRREEARTERKRAEDEAYRKRQQRQKEEWDNSLLGRASNALGNFARDERSGPGRR